MSKETIPGTRSVAHRIVQAERNFVQLVMEKGFSRPEAEKILRVYRKLKVVKLDAVLGRITVKHGAYWELEPLRNALNYGNKTSNPMAKRARTHTAKFDRCVRSVRHRLKGVQNPYAVCMAALGQKALRKRKRTRR